ncbi:MAG: hypothetical protein PWQ17_772 [Anaerophaga sp.]|nr:hypothetical protein [Anaerophaga sp.]
MKDEWKLTVIRNPLLRKVWIKNPQQRDIVFALLRPNICAFCVEKFIRALKNI